jgi:5'-3' exoribonuclease 2
LEFRKIVDANILTFLFLILLSVTGNDFLPHLPSLDIRDGALDYLFNVYKRILPTLGDYITNHGGQVNLSHVDVILAEVGAIEDYVFSMKHANEENDKKRRQEQKERKKYLTKDGKAPRASHPGGDVVESAPKMRGRAARILGQEKQLAPLGNNDSAKSKHKSLKENAEVAAKLKASLLKDDTETGKDNGDSATSPLKRKVEEIYTSNDEKVEKDADDAAAAADDDDYDDSESQVGQTETSEDETETEAKEVVYDQAKVDAAEKLLKQRMKAVEQKKLNDFAANVDDKVRLHEKGWKVRWLFLKFDVANALCCIYLLSIG